MSRAVVVIGLARTGAAVARALAAEGDRVVVVDRADDARVRERAATLPSGVEVRLGGYDVDVAAGADLVSPSPGVPWDAPELEWARARGIAVRSEIDLVLERCPSRVIGITGTNGKTTTTALVAAILEQGPDRVVVGGNIGVPVLDRLDGLRPSDWVVLELSSFQIETVSEPRCTVACVLNVTPDHLDRHGDFVAYAAIKERLVRFASDWAVLGFDDETTRAMAQNGAAPVRYFGFDLDGHDGATVRRDEVVTVAAGAASPVLPLADIPLFGVHNVANVLAAVAVSDAAGMAPPAMAAGIRGFRPVPHRLEPVLERDGVLWVNDSKATNAESAVVGLEAFAGRPIVWIGGGDPEAEPPVALIDAVADRSRAAVLNGASARLVDAALAKRGYAERSVVATLAEAVAVARDAARPGDVVLLSPGYKSFDQFRDFEERGDVFRELVTAGPPQSAVGHS
ncbi:MAG: UDP-N-acetylmuramoyl-L-alanine--D-glutamate ligase [Candidatus Dormibacteraeota bacterium]|nr:UDP-N-acetylmuramoyl-L-alanine--D-glutamate ligase [Candidatus Dormibacteraeota bacterium]